MSTKRPVIPDARIALDQFKEEVANELGIDDKITNPNNMEEIAAKVTERIGNAGNIGGEMVKRMISQAEMNMVQNTKE